MASAWAVISPIWTRGRARIGLGYVPQGRGILGDMTVEKEAPKLIEGSSML
jgi:ABC-type branched-subunit amino acid transport system ATPase component